MRSMENLDPNVIIAFSILLTIFKAKTDQNAMKQCRLNKLTIFSMKKNIAKSFKYDDIVASLMIHFHSFVESTAKARTNLINN